jgi:hypothetical protein
MRQSVSHFVRRVYNVIPDVHTLSTPPTRRRIRAPFEFVADASHWLFGTARASDVDTLRVALQQMQQGLEVSAADARKTREGLSTITKLQNERLDKLHAVLREEQASLAILQADARATVETTVSELTALTATINELSRFTSLHDDLQELSLGVDETLHGTISPKLVTIAQLRKMLVDVNTALAKNTARLCYTTVRDIYASRNFDVARMQTDLIIRLRLPYTRLPRMYVYKVLKYASSVAGPQQYVSRIREFPQYLIIEPTKGLVGELSELPQSTVVENANIVLA